MGSNVKHTNSSPRSWTATWPKLTCVSAVRRLFFIFFYSWAWRPICMTHQKAFCRGGDQRLTEIQTVGRIKMAASLKRTQGSCSPRLSKFWTLCARGDVSASYANCQWPGTDRRRTSMLPSDLLPTSSVKHNGFSDEAAINLAWKNILFFFKLLPNGQSHGLLCRYNYIHSLAPSALTFEDKTVICTTKQILT